MPQWVQPARSAEFWARTRATIVTSNVSETCATPRPRACQRGCLCGQDLILGAREHELAFTIMDRTGPTYSFGERSQGLRCFLSYFVQLTAQGLTQARPDILLLDEPDAFLSCVG